MKSKKQSYLSVADLRRGDFFLVEGDSPVANENFGHLDLTRNSKLACLILEVKEFPADPSVVRMQISIRAEHGLRLDADENEQRSYFQVAYILGTSFNSTAWKPTENFACYADKIMTQW